MHSPVNAFCTTIYRRKVDFQLVTKFPRFSGTECSLPCSKAVFFNKVFAINRKMYKNNEKWRRNSKHSSKYHGYFRPAVGSSGIIFCVLTSGSCFLAYKRFHRQGFLGIGKIILGAPPRNKG
jgi:hypothetical protein